MHISIESVNKYSEKVRLSALLEQHFPKLKVSSKWLEAPWLSDNFCQSIAFGGSGAPLEDHTHQSPPLCQCVGIPLEKPP